MPLNLYTKRRYLADLAACDSILRAAREGVCDKAITGLALIAFEAKIANMRKQIHALWAENGRWFGALAKAKRDWARKQFGEHDHESLKRLAFLRFVVAQILNGVDNKPVDAKFELEFVPNAGPWARERATRNRSFMPDCDYEICVGGRWQPMQKQDLPDRVRWV